MIAALRHEITRALEIATKAERTDDGNKQYYINGVVDRLGDILKDARFKPQPKKPGTVTSRRAQVFIPLKAATIKALNKRTASKLVKFHGRNSDPFSMRD